MGLFQRLRRRLGGGDTISDTPAPMSVQAPDAPAHEPGAGETAGAPAAVEETPPADESPSEAESGGNGGDGGGNGGNGGGNGGGD